MKRLLQILMVLFVVCMAANAQTFSDDFTGLTAGTNLAGQSSWTKGGSGPDATVGNTTPLTYPLYNMGGGEYVVMPTGTGTSSRVYKTFTSPIANFAHSTIYYSVLLRLTATGANSDGYFMSFGNSGAGTQYGGKLFARTSGAGYNIGLSKTSNTAAFGASVLELNKTYLIVVRYSFNNTGFAHADSIDDEAYLWVNPSPNGEPSIASAECAIASGTGGTDFDGFSPNPNPYDIGNFIWHNRKVTNPAGAFDGVRVGYGATSALAWGNLNAFVNPFDDPQSLTVKNAENAITLDGKLDEADWNGAPTLLFGNGAFLKKQAGEQTVTGGADVKASFDSYGVTYHKPNTDSSVTRVKFLRKGTDLYIGLQSNDKSICKFDWEADGLFLKIKNSAGVDKEYKLYYQNIGTNADTMRLEEAVLNSSAGVGFLPAGSKANDTTSADNGYTAEFKLKLASLGFDASTTSLSLALNIFDPDGFQYDATQPWPFGMMPFDSARGSYYKSWWGSEWGGTYRTLNLTPEVVKYDDPQSLKVKNAENAVTLDGKLDEADWNGAPTLVFGNGAFLKKQAGEFTVTNGADVKASFDSYGVTYHKPNTDSSVTRVKFLRKGTDLYIGMQSNDKSICRFDWEGDGLFLKVKNAAGDAKEYKLYYQNIAGNADTMRLEEAVLNSSAGMGFLPTGSTANDTTNVDNGYTAEFKLKLASLGFDANTTSLQVAVNIFDPDGFQFDATKPWPYGMIPFDSARGSYFKSWWGSEWGSEFRTLTLEKEVVKFDDPQSLTVKNAGAAPTLDGKLDEADWNGAPTLVFGNGAYLNKQPGEFTVTNGADVKASFDSYGVTYHKPNTDSSVTRVKFLRKGTDLYIGLQSNDKSICRFDWEGDGLFLKIKNSTGDDKEYKLYYQNIVDTTASTMRLEEAILNSSAGKGFLPAGSTVNDTTNVDNGYTAEFKLKLASLGFDASTTALTVAVNIFDPDGFQFDATKPWPFGMIPFDSARGSYYKSWWGSEWGGTYRTLNLTPEYDNPDTMTTVTAQTVTVDGKLDEPEWASAPALVFGPPNAPKSGTDKTVTGGVDVKASFDSYGVTYHMPYKDTSYARVKFMQKGLNLYIGIQSNDKSICKFDWEGDGMFLKVKNSTGDAKEYKLYYQNIDANASTMRLEEAVLNSSAGVGVLGQGSTVNDTTNVDNGYTAEFMLKLGSLGFDNSVKTLQVAMSIFDPDGFQHPMAPWDSARGTYYKSWWGSEWGDVFKTIKLNTITGVAGSEMVPMVYAMSQNYPNPFNPTTNIKFSVPQASLVKIVVFDLIGREVATLANGTYAPGYYTVPFNAQHLSSGMYLYRMTSTSLSDAHKTFTDTKKLMLVK